MKRVKINKKKTRCGHKYFQQTKKVITRRQAFALLALKILKKLFISDCTTPFEVSVVTDATADAIVTTIANGDVGKIVAI